MTSSSFFRGERDDIKRPFISDLHIFLEISFQTFNLLLVHDPWVHPELKLIIVFSDFDTDAVHGVNEFIFGTDQTKNSIFP